MIGGLLSHDLPSIQRKAIELLNTKLQQQKEIIQGDVSFFLSFFFFFFLSFISNLFSEKNNNCF